jgi:hypothetical protein
MLLSLFFILNFFLNLIIFQITAEKTEASGCTAKLTFNFRAIKIFIFGRNKFFSDGLFIVDILFYESHFLRKTMTIVSSCFESGDLPVLSPKYAKYVLLFLRMV